MENREKRSTKLAFPIVVQNGVSFLINFVDNIMVGQLGKEAMSGVAVVNQLVFVFNTCILGHISGASIFGAQFFGSGDEEGLRQTFRFRLTACLLLSAAALLLFWFAGAGMIRQFLHSQNNGAEIADTFAFGKNYMSIIMISLIPSALTQVYAGTAKDMGKTFLPMCASVTAAAPLFPGLYNTTEKVRALATDFMYILALCIPLADLSTRRFLQSARAAGRLSHFCLTVPSCGS